ncbi:pyridoxal phosphate-dependent aminotransferase [Mesorhizobium sp. CO1-1-8]|uniref:pyridoxal phosphate-dependent aminotransferase n=1 Tax=Mesorhizobium sp. CO1-1-8 TaxID=2876631 RepID=UPI001CD147DB|nr:pyridoxal phosphate-dependent aminotransferase [Mesorhizobium sp. CO1-1-8]MBZ9772220.1 pyridoxal phosphate-dependent aminotransferase [Mesorhizobium sp. CO1-1-8]
MTLVKNLRLEAREAPPSGIYPVIDYGRGKAGLIPLWAGEGHLVTPSFIRDAAVQGLTNGETFYTYQAGIPDLREALARYHTRNFDRTFSSDEFIVTAGGMHAIMLALQATAGKGDEVLYLSPAWPNLPAAAAVAGAIPVPVPLREGSNGWICDIDAIEAAVTPRTTALFLNTPSNPTGWVASHDDLRQILELARRHGLWIIADEIYSLFSFEGRRAPSFYDVMDAEDRVVFVNTFSKNWAMTGWRVGWLNVHPSLSKIFENLVQCSTSGVPQFLQRGAIAALDEGDGFLAEQISTAKTARDALCKILSWAEGIRFSVPQGAFYLFFSIDGLKDSKEAAFELVDKANVGVAPGSAFGRAGNGYLRICFLRDLKQVEEAANRVADWARAR